MSAYALTPLARADVFEIWSFIDDDNEEAANRVEQAIFDARYPNYTIVYRPETNPLQTVAVLHGKRNVQRILRSR